MGDQVHDPARRGDEFRSHWFAFPVSLFLHDRDPDGPPLSIELRTGDRPAVIEVSGGEVKTRLGYCGIPGPGPRAARRGSSSACSRPTWTPAQAQERGLAITGDPAILRRLQDEPFPIS